MVHLWPRQRVGPERGSLGVAEWGLCWISARPVCGARRRRRPREKRIAVITIVDDPRYLSQPFITSTHFKRASDGSRWTPMRAENQWGRRFPSFAKEGNLRPI